MKQCTIATALKLVQMAGNLREKAPLGAIVTATRVRDSHDSLMIQRNVALLRWRQEGAETAVTGGRIWKEQQNLDGGACGIESL